MITVKQLREELLKFRDDAVCYALEDEIVISEPGKWRGPSHISCEFCDTEEPTYVDSKVAAHPIENKS